MANAACGGSGSASSPFWSKPTIVAGEVVSKEKRLTYIDEIKASCFYAKVDIEVIKIAAIILKFFKPKINDFKFSPEEFIGFLGEHEKTVRKGAFDFDKNFIAINYAGSLQKIIANKMMLMILSKTFDVELESLMTLRTKAIVSDLLKGVSSFLIIKIIAFDYLKHPSQKNIEIFSDKDYLLRSRGLGYLFLAQANYLLALNVINLVYLKELYKDVKIISIILDDLEILFYMRAWQASCMN